MKNKKKKKNLKKVLGRMKAWKICADSVMFIASALSAGKIIRYIENHFSAKKKRNDAADKLIIAGWIAGIGAALFFGAKFLLKHVRKMRGGYLFDIFDRDKFDIADADGARELEDEVRSDLSVGDAPVVSESTGRCASVPLDEDANETNLG